ncbi:MAG: hypothetical protein ACOX4L_04135 [Bacillota bacterium]|jgi:hypothetical protein
MEKKSRSLMFIVALVMLAGIFIFTGCTQKSATTPGETKKPAVTSKPVDKNTSPGKKEAVINGDFEKGIEGWVLDSGRIKTSNDGNRYLRVGNSWQNFQLLHLEQNTLYNFNAVTRKYTGDQEVRFKIVFFDNHAQRLGYYNIFYKHQGDGWEKIPPQAIKVPDGTKETIIYLMAEGKNDLHNFDNISLTKDSVLSIPVPAKIITIRINNSPEKISNGGFESNAGWSGLENRVIKDPSGNRYLKNGYNWDVVQKLTLAPNTNYKFTAQTRKGSAEGPAHFVIAFLDQQGQRLPSGYNFHYSHQGTDWESIPEQTIITPSEFATAVIYVLSDTKGEGSHHFDNISLVAKKQ